MSLRLASTIGWLINGCTLKKNSDSSLRSFVGDATILTSYEILVEMILLSVPESFKLFRSSLTLKLPPPFARRTLFEVVITESRTYTFWEHAKLLRLFLSIGFFLGFLSI